MIRAIVLWTLMPEAQLSDVILALAGDLALLPWSRRWQRHVRLRSGKWDLDSHTSYRSLPRLAGNPDNKPAARNDHAAQLKTAPALNRFA